MTILDRLHCSSTAAASTTTTSSSSGLSSSRSTGKLQRSARNAAGRLAGAKRTSHILLALAEMEECADERRQRWKAKEVSKMQN